jgi:hypothetical protein
MAKKQSNRSSRARSQGNPKALSAVANQIASEVFQDGCTRVFRAAAVWTPKGSTKRTVDLYLAAMRQQLECHEQSWTAQQVQPAHKGGAS